jgi:hypothetical protein
MSKRDYDKAVEKINKRGVLLVYPIKNQKEPHSLWSEFYPKTEMKWSWDEDSDNRVGRMWLLMKQLSQGGDVVYSKWYSGRATFFSKELFESLLVVSKDSREELQFSNSSKEIYDVLLSDSPLSTKILKKQTGLVGKDLNSTFERSMKTLYKHFLIVGFGEVDDGAFPSAAVGATSLLFEDLWKTSNKVNLKEAYRCIDHFMPHGEKMRNFLNKILLSSKP